MNTKTAKSQSAFRFLTGPIGAMLAIAGTIATAVTAGMPLGAVFSALYLGATAFCYVRSERTAVLNGQRGAGELGQIMTGMIIFVVGLIVATVVNAVAASTGSNANIGSFTGAQDINDLLPTLFYISVMTAGLTVAGFGVVGAVGFRPGQ